MHLFLDSLYFVDYVIFFYQLNIVSIFNMLFFYQFYVIFF